MRVSMAAIIDQAGRKFNVDEADGVSGRDNPSAPPGRFDAVSDGLVDVSYVTVSYTPAQHVLPLMPKLPGSGETALINPVAYSRIHWKYFRQVGKCKADPEQLGERRCSAQAATQA